MSSGTPPIILISFSPEQFIYLLIAIVVATAGVILWVKRETDGLRCRLTKVETDIEHIKKRDG